ncbi:MAG: L,D-transpeptidase family protein [Candidatus Choladocola sp.]|nr:L,D-transpeptidase family protein [Candidatus Choladocola sp.]
MKIKKIISAFCLAAGLALSVPAISSQIGVTGTASTVMAAEGWNQDANGCYYLQGSTRLTGLQKIGGSTYYFNANGYRLTGAVRINNYTYYFRPDNGALQTGVSGLVKDTVNKNTYYYFNSAKNGSIAVNAWVKSNGGYFYANASGQVKLGTIKVGSKLYHITATGRLTSYKKSSFDKKYYYAASNGVLKTKLQTINGRLYYFNPKTGERQTGTIKVGKYTYHFNGQNGRARIGWAQLTYGDKKNWYYFDSKGRRVSGFQTIKNNRYYFNPKNNDARVENCWMKIGKNRYYFNSKGVIQTGFFTVNGKRYYATSTGVRKTGWQTVNGHRYFMDTATGVMKTGWFTYKGQKYYLNPTKSSSTYGAAKVGWTKISGSWYYFNNDGSMKTGWLIDNMKYYYLDKTTGKMLTGKHKIDGKVYDFGTSGGFSANISGEWCIRVNRKNCCITIYKGNTPVKAMICSTARAGHTTPTGTFRLLDKLRWHELIGPSWGQYCSHITSDILFHSVTYTRYHDNHSLFTGAYNNLGSPASAGCIRLRVIDAKWMYENCPIGTKVIISDNEAMPLGKPTITKIPANQNYDPTDPYA